MTQRLSFFALTCASARKRSPRSGSYAALIHAGFQAADLVGLVPGPSTRHTILVGVAPHGVAANAKVLLSTEGFSPLVLVDTHQYGVLRAIGNDGTLAAPDCLAN